MNKNHQIKIYIKKAKLDSLLSSLPKENTFPPQNTQSMCHVEFLTNRGRENVAHPSTDSKEY